MSIPPLEKQCHCQYCNLDRDQDSYWSADSLLHCGTQANYTNYENPQLSGWHSTPKMIKENLYYIINSWLDKISPEDWENLLKHYDHLDFDIRFKGWKRKQHCDCSLETLNQSGCQCGGI